MDVKPENPSSKSGSPKKPEPASGTPREGKETAVPVPSKHSTIRKKSVDLSALQSKSFLGPRTDKADSNPASPSRGDSSLPEDPAGANLLDRKRTNSFSSNRLPRANRSVSVIINDSEMSTDDQQTRAYRVLSVADPFYKEDAEASNLEERTSEEDEEETTPSDSDNDDEFSYEEPASPDHTSVHNFLLRSYTDGTAMAQSCTKEKAREILLKKPVDRTKEDVSQLGSYMSRHMAFFQQMSREVLLRLVKLISLQTVDEGDLIVNEGESGEIMYSVFSGACAVYQKSSGLEEDDEGPEMSPERRASLKQGANGQSPAQQVSKWKQHRQKLRVIGRMSALMTDANQRLRKKSIEQQMRRMSTPLTEEEVAKAVDLSLERVAEDGTGRTVSARRDSAFPPLLLAPTRQRQNVLWKGDFVLAGGPMAEASSKAAGKELKRQSMSHKMRESLTRIRSQIQPEAEEDEVPGAAWPGLYVGSVHEGEGFGEGCLQFEDDQEAPVRCATVVAVDEGTELVIVDRNAYRMAIMGLDKHNLYLPEYCYALMAKPPTHRTKSDLKKLQEFTSNLPLFKNLKPEVRLKLVESMVCEQHPPKTALCLQGKQGESMYVILKGSCKAHIKVDGQGAVHRLIKSPDEQGGRPSRAAFARSRSSVVGASGRRGDDEVPVEHTQSLDHLSPQQIAEAYGPAVRTMAAGDCFGELALLTGLNKNTKGTRSDKSGLRSASVITASDCTVIKVLQADYNWAFREVHEEYLRSQVEFLARIDLLSEVSKEDLAHLYYFVEPLKCAWNHTVFRQGQQLDSLFIVKSGSVKLIQVHENDEAEYDKEVRANIERWQSSRRPAYSRSWTVVQRNVLHPRRDEGEDASLRHARHSVVELSILGPNNFFGEEMFTSGWASYQAVTATACELLVLPCAGGMPHLSRRTLQHFTDFAQMRHAFHRQVRASIEEMKPVLEPAAPPRPPEQQVPPSRRVGGLASFRKHMPAELPIPIPPHPADLPDRLSPLPKSPRPSKRPGTPRDQPVPAVPEALEPRPHDSPPRSEVPRHAAAAPPSPPRDRDRAGGEAGRWSPPRSGGDATPGPRPQVDPYVIASLMGDLDLGVDRIGSIAVPGFDDPGPASTPLSPGRGGARWEAGGGAGAGKLRVPPLAMQKLQQKAHQSGAFSDRSQLRSQPHPMQPKWSRWQFPKKKRGQWVVRRTGHSGAERERGGPSGAQTERAERAHPTPPDPEPAAPRRKMVPYGGGAHRDRRYTVLRPPPGGPGGMGTSRSSENLQLPSVKQAAQNASPSLLPSRPCKATSLFLTRYCHPNEFIPHKNLNESEAGDATLHIQYLSMCQRVPGFPALPN